jgi:hypothetical protein
MDLNGLDPALMSIGASDFGSLAGQPDAGFDGSALGVANAPLSSTLDVASASSGGYEGSLHPGLIGLAVLFVAVEACKHSGACAANSMSFIERKIDDLFQQVVRRGGSGRVISHTVKHRSRKAARDAAAADSAQGQAPIHDPASNGNPPHYHPADAQGNRGTPNVHHDYPG